MRAISSGAKRSGHACVPHFFRRLAVDHRPFVQTVTGELRHPVPGETQEAREPEPVFPAGADRTPPGRAPHLRRSPDIPASANIPGRHRPAARHRGRDASAAASSRGSGNIRRENPPRDAVRRATAGPGADRSTAARAPRGRSGARATRARSGSQEVAAERFTARRSPPFPRESSRTRARSAG